MKSHRKPREAAIALVLSLSMILLVTIAVVAFFSFATANRRVESSRTNRIEAEILTKTGAAHVIGRLTGEIADPARSRVDLQRGVAIYTPKAVANGVPKRALSSAINVADESFSNLISQSVPEADPLASSHSTSTSARDGRYLTAARWNSPALIRTGFATPDQLPKWIYVDRNNGISATPGANTIGRFAYNLYDVGGLLNANAVGYPAGLSPVGRGYLSQGQAGTDLMKLASSTAPVLPLLQADIDKLAKFRYPDLTNIASDEFGDRTFGAMSKGLLSVSNVSPQSGTAFVQNMFHTRQDLIQYAKAQNAHFQEALPYLTHFSRSLNSPSVVPPSNNASETHAYGNVAIQKIRFSNQGDVAHYDDDGQATTYAVNAGEPFVQRRFSLEKLAWLTPAGPAKSELAGPIQACFGLRWNSSQERWDYVGATGTTPLSEIKSLTDIALESSPRELNFFEMLKAGILEGALGSHANARPTIGENSTSIIAESGIAGDPFPFDANKDLHILQIGMNILDNADTDNFPAVAALTFAGLAVERAGVEDLPFFYSFDFINTRWLDWNFGSVAAPVVLQVDNPATLTINESRFVENGKESYYNPATTRRYVYHYLFSDLFWVPELFNPHQVSTPTSGPGSLRVRIVDGVLIKVNYFENGLTGTKPIPEPDLSVCPELVFQSDKFENFRNIPQPIKDASSPRRLGALRPELEGPGFPTADPPRPVSVKRDELAFRIYTYQPNSTLDPRYFSVNDASGKMPVVELENLIVALEYMTPNGNWKTYTTLGGEQAFPVDTGIIGILDDAFDASRGGRFPVFKQSSAITDNSNYNDPNLQRPDQLFGTHLQSWDPRTHRYGFGFMKYMRTIGQPPSFDGAPYVMNPDGTRMTPNTNPSYFLSAYLFRNPDATARYWTGLSGDLARVTGNLPQHSAFEDPDFDAALGPRPPDAGIGFVNKSTATPANPYKGTTTNKMKLDAPADLEKRPVILQRPYRNVAELGYVFRDVPWQTLNFYNDRTGDSALLDLFAVSDEPKVTAGKIGLTGTPKPVLKAVLAGAYEKPDSSSPLTDVEIDRVAAALKNFNYESNAYKYDDGSGTLSRNLPPNVSSLPNFLSSVATHSAMADKDALDPIKWKREAVVRSLSATQTRTWNVLVDVVAQVGRFPKGATAAKDFLIEGESRAWVSVALDRYTGQKIDSQTEKVHE